MKDLEFWTKAYIKDLVNGYAKNYVIDNIKIELDEDMEDFYDSQILLRKRIWGRWELMETYCFGTYVKDSFLNYDKMVEDIADGVRKHHESPKKKGWD